MSRISAGIKKTIEEIKRLADGSIDDQLIACKELLQKKILPNGKPKRGVNKSVIQELLPTIIKFIESNDHVLQKEGAGFIIDITNTPDEANSKLAIDAGVIPKLINLLSSSNSDVLVSAVKAFHNIAHGFPEKVVENEILQSMIQCLKSENKKVSYPAARFMYHISFKSEERITAIFEANGVELLIALLESKYNGVCEESLDSLINIISCNGEFCQRVLDLGALKNLKKLCDRLFAVETPGKSNVKDDKSKLKKEEDVKLSAIRLIRNITYYGEAEVNLIINGNFLPLIFEQIKSGMTPDIKIESIKVFENVIAAKPDLIPSFINDHYIVSLLCNSFPNKNADLIITTLTTLCNIVEKFEDQYNIRQEILRRVNLTNLLKLSKHKNEEIRRLATMLFQFVCDIKPDLIAGISSGSNGQEPEVIELDSENDDTPPTRPQRKRPATTSVGPLRRCKRFRVSLEQTDTGNNERSSDDDRDHDQNNDFDDHPINSSPAGAAPTESNRHDHSGRQSIVGDDTVTTDDGPSRLNSKTEAPTTLQNNDMSTSAASRQSPDLPVAVSTNNETDQNEMKPSPCDRLGNSSRLSTNNSHNVNVSTNGGNIRSNHAERPTAVDSETVATADEIIRNDVNPGKQSPADADLGNTLSRPSSAFAPALPVATSLTINETNSNDIASRKPSPIPQSVITLNLTNQVTPPTAATNNDGIIRDEIIRYWHPAEFLIDQYCDTLGIQFNRDNYDIFISNVKFTQITSISKPDKSFTANDKSGFGCLSILLTGNVDSADKIRNHINKKFIDFMDTFDKEKIKDVTFSPIMLAEHLETIATWLKCRILVYCNGWKKYGSWDEQNPMIPLFVLEKKEIEGKTEYCIVWTLKND